MKVQAVILDWAGTVVDHGSRAPMGAFVRAFAQFGLTISIAEARGPMGMAKWDHIRAMAQVPSVAAAWRSRHGRDFSEGDVDAIFQVFEPMSIAAVRDHADIIPGAIAAIHAMRARGMSIAGTTGYTRPIIDVLEPLAAASGLRAGVDRVRRRSSRGTAESADDVVRDGKARRLARRKHCEGG